MSSRPALQLVAIAELDGSRGTLGSQPDDLLRR